MKKNNVAFTVIEILIIVAIIGILASIIFVSLGSIRTRSKDNSVFQMMNQVQLSALTCLHEVPRDPSNATNKNPRINDPRNATNRSLCLDATDGTGYYLPSYSAWPYSEDDSGNINTDLFFNKYGWDYDWTDEDVQKGGISWCKLGYNGDTCPDSLALTGTYLEPGFGGNFNSKQFCFRIKSPGSTGTKCIWCTEDGCKKDF